MSGRIPDEGRYSKVSRRMWGDERFQALSAPKPNAQTLWKRLLTGPELGCIPGLYAARIGGLADALKWPLKATQKCWDEIAAQGMAEADWAAGLVWVPNAIRHNEPTSPNTVAAWRKAANQLPECALRAKAFLALAEYLTEMGPTWIGAWGLADGAGWRPAKITPEVRDLVRKRDGDDCRYCGITASWSDRKGSTGATYDHVDPTGPASPDNIVVCCRSCNSRKGFRTPEMAGMALAIRSNRLPEPNPDKSGTDLGNGPVRIQIPITIQEQDSGARDPKAEPRILKIPQVVAPEPVARDGGAEVGRNSGGERARCPGNLADALLLPLADRCRLALEDPHQASFCQVSEWPEVQTIARTFENVFQRTPIRFGGIRQDAGLRAILERLAEGHTQAELCRAITVARDDEWFRKAPRGLSAFTPEVLRQLLEKSAPKRSQARPPVKVPVPEDESKYTRCPPELLAGLGVKRVTVDAADDVRAILEAADATNGATA